MDTIGRAGWRLIALSLCAAAICAFQSHAQAEVVFESANLRATTHIRLDDRAASEITERQDSDDRNPGLADFPVTANRSDEAAGSGMSVSDTSTQFSQVTFDEETGVLSGTMTGDASGEASVPTEAVGSASTSPSATCHVIFEVKENPAALAVTGQLTSSSPETCDNASATYDVSDPASTGHIVLIRTCSVPDLLETRNIDDTRVLPPGRYKIHFSAAVGISVWAGEDVSSSAGFDVTFSVTPMVETSPEFVFWEGLNGDFDDKTNWEPQVMPDSSMTAVFDKDAEYAVTIGTAASQRVLVERGFVEFLDGSYEVFGGSEESASIVVGNTSEDTPYLSLENHTLVTEYGTIGEEADTNGTLRVFEAGAAWNVQGRLTIGKGGVGALFVIDGATGTSGETLLGVETGSEGSLQLSNATAADSTEPLPLAWTSGPMSVGLKGLGVVRISGAKVNSGTVTLGVEPGSQGDAFVGSAIGEDDEDGPGIPGEWFSQGHLIVGDHGSGGLTVKHGSAAGPGSEWDIVLGWEPGSIGEVQVHGVQGFSSALGTPNLLAVGLHGEGILWIEQGGRVFAGELSVGSESGSSGEVIVSGAFSPEVPSGLSVTGNLVVGSHSMGTLIIEDGGEVQSKEASIGAFPGGDGTVTVDAAKWMNEEFLWIGPADGTGGEDEEPGTGKLLLKNGGKVKSTEGVALGPGSSIEGCGTLETDNYITNGGGNVAPDLCVGKQAGGMGALTIDGSYRQTGGLIEIEIGGINPGAYDVLEVTGHAELTGGSIKLIFVDGYLPETGDTVPFLTAGGALTMESVSLLHEGVAEGFELQVNEESGALVFEALNDAAGEGEPVPEGDPGGEGEGRGEGESPEEGETPGEGESPDEGEDGGTRQALCGGLSGGAGPIEPWKGLGNMLIIALALQTLLIAAIGRRVRSPGANMR